MAKNYYMACLDLEGRRALVVGGGSVGLEKASGLSACGARVTVVSPELDERFADFDVDWIARRTGGASPALAKRLRSQIAELVGPEHAELAEELRALRPAVKEQFETYQERRDHFEDLVTERLA